MRVRFACGDCLLIQVGDLHDAWSKRDPKAWVGMRCSKPRCKAITKHQVEKLLKEKVKDEDEPDAT